jgi:L-Ala-D/L-Glu epimerase
MAIASVEVVPYALPFKEPYVTARGTLERREMVLLRLRDEDGVVGLGEAVPLSLRGGAPLETVVAELESWAERARESGDLWEPAQMSAPAMCAVRTAQVDLAARHAGAPLFLLLKASGEAQPVQCNATLTAGKPVDVARQALAWAEDGFRTFKLKVGVEEDTELVRMVREAVGPEAKLRLDANGTWTIDEAAANLAALAQHDIQLVEQPVATLEEMVALRERSDLPIAADESVETVGDAQRAHVIVACDYLAIKLSKVGKVDLEDFGFFPLYVTSALDGPVGIAAAAHAVQPLREQNVDDGLAHGLATQRLFAETIASVECELRGDQLHLPDGPGLGVEIDESALAHHRL